MPGPISPSEVMGQKVNSIPDFVFEAFNKCIAKNWNGRSSIVLQKEVVAEIRSLQSGTEFAGLDPFKEHWLDVESVYENNGWRVEYDKPSYYESYEPSFTFREKK